MSSSINFNCHVRNVKITLYDESRLNLSWFYICLISSGKTKSDYESLRWVSCHYLLCPLIFVHWLDLSLPTCPQGKTVTLKLKTVKFETVTRGQSLLIPTSDLEQIYSTARDLLRAEMQNSAPEPLHLRLMGNNYLVSMFLWYFSDEMWNRMFIISVFVLFQWL